MRKLQIRPSRPRTKEALAAPHLAATAADNVAVAGVDFVVDGVVVGRAIPPTYAVDVQVTQPAGSILRISALARDASENTSSSDGLTRVLAAPTGQPAAITGRVYDDTTGLPIAGVRITLTGSDASGHVYDASSTSSDRGEYYLAVSGGEGTLRLATDGFTHVDRPLLIPDAAATVAFDARLTPLGAAQPLSAVFGGAVAGRRTIAPSTDIVDAALTVSPGALLDDSTLRLTVIGPQGLQGLLPAGWVPVGAIDIAPHGFAFSAPQAISMANRLRVGSGPRLVLAMWDESAAAWRAFTTVVVTDG